MRHKHKYASRQIRRAAERRAKKLAVQKEQARKGKKRKASDQPKRKKIDWKLTFGIIGAIATAIGTIIKVAEFILTLL